MIEFLLIFSLALFLAALCLFIGYKVLFMATMLHGPVYVPSADDKLTTMLELPTIKKNARILDLGSGNGKVVIAAAHKFQSKKVKVDGVEINPLLVRTSRQHIAAAGLNDSITIIQQSFWKTDLGQYDIVFLYGTSYIMKKLEAKVLKEMKPGSQFVSNHFQFPNLQPATVKNGVYLYRL